VGLSALTNGGMIDVRLRSVQCGASGVASEKKCKCRVTSAWTRHCLCVCLFYAISTSPQKNMRRHPLSSLFHMEAGSYPYFEAGAAP
jgi:hypothetical protein